MVYPTKVFHWIRDEESASASGQFFEKRDPVTGGVMAEVVRGTAEDVKKAIAAAGEAFPEWSQWPVIKRADLLRDAVFLMRERKEELIDVVAQESGKPRKSAADEVMAAIECGFFFAGEGRRFSGDVLTSAVPNREVKLIRQPVGVGALITPFNSPSAGVAWKLFPALLSGNAVVLKSHELTPYVGIWYAKIFKDTGLPTGVLSVIQGYGAEVGASLVEDRRVSFVSLTGSVATGAVIIKATADRLAKVSVESGGKNPLVVCDDAAMEHAVASAVQAGFVDAGQRCVAASRIIIFDSVYDEFKAKFLEHVSRLNVGIGENDDYGAMISEERMQSVLDAVDEAIKRGATLLTGGKRIGESGYFIEPTVLENADPKDAISQKELFGPVVVLYRVKNLEEAIQRVNDSEFGLGSAIHTQNMHRAHEFVSRVRAGVVRVNGPTHGSEPHMPFGGVGLSGNGWREPGEKALDFYSEWKQISIDYDPTLI